MDKQRKIFVAGHRGMVGSALIRRLRELGYENLIMRDRHELNLLDQEGVATFFREERPDWVFLAAAKVGGIHANNTFRGQFLYENLQIQNNVIHSAYMRRSVTTRTICQKHAIRERVSERQRSGREE